MALPQYIFNSSGTPIVWGVGGASGVTHPCYTWAMSYGACRMGTAADLGSNFADTYEVYFKTDFNSAPTTKFNVSVYIVSSSVSGSYPAGVTGADAAYTRGANDVTINRAGPPVCVLSCTPEAAVQIQQPVLWTPKGRYVVPIIWNDSGQQLRQDGVVTDHATRLMLIPRRKYINE